MFCGACGARLGPVPEATEELEPVRESPRATHVVARQRQPNEQLSLLVRQGPNEGARYQLSASDIRIGRNPESYVFLNDISVSRNHAVITFGDGVHRLCDLDSLNGTYLNGTRIRQTCPVRHGDELQIGRFKLIFLASGGG